MRTLAPALLSLALLLPPAARAEAPEVQALLEQADDAYARRDEGDALAEVRTKLEEAQKLSPDDYGVLWRLARLEFWISDDPNLPAKEKSRVGKLAWELGDLAAKANPEGVQGWHYAAAGMGNYALGIGIFQALGEGIEAKFKERLGKAEKLEPDFEHGAIQTAWGRFWYKLPWPKHDGKKSEKSLRAALALNPDNVRAHVYLADLYLKQGKKAEARERAGEGDRRPARPVRRARGAAHAGGGPGAAGQGLERLSAPPARSASSGQSSSSRIAPRGPVAAPQVGRRRHGEREGPAHRLPEPPHPQLGARQVDARHPGRHLPDQDRVLGEVAAVGVDQPRARRRWRR